MPKFTTNLAGKSVTVVRVGQKSASFTSSLLLSRYTSGSFAGDGVTSTFTLSQIPVIIYVFYNGQKILPGAGALKFTTSGTSLILGTVPENGAEIFYELFY